MKTDVFLFSLKIAGCYEITVRSPAKNDVKERISSWIERLEDFDQNEDDLKHHPMEPLLFYGHPIVKVPRIIPLRRLQPHVFLEDPRHEPVIKRFREKLRAIVMRVWVQRYRNVYSEEEVLKELEKVVIRYGLPMLWQYLILFYEKPSVYFECLPRISQLTNTLGKILEISGPEIPPIIPTEQVKGVSDPRLYKDRVRKHQIKTELKLIRPQICNRVRALPDLSTNNGLDADISPRSKRVCYDSCAVGCSSEAVASGIQHKDPTQTNGF